MRLFGTALALLLALLAVPEVSHAGSDTLVACSLHGQLVLQLRADCLLAGGQPADGRGHDADVGGAALSVENDAGVALRSVFACRTTEALVSVTSIPPEHRSMLAQSLVQTGDCTRIDRTTGFAVVERGAGALRVRVPTAGLLWVSERVEVPNVDRLRLAGYPLKPDSEAGGAPPGSTEDEQRKNQAEPSKKETRNDDGHMRTCNCGNKVRIRAQRDCREACGVAFRGVVHDDCDDEGCYWHGELMSPKDMVDQRTREPGMQ